MAMPKNQEIVGIVARSIVQEAPKLPTAARMLQLAQRLRLDLAYSFTRQLELLADFFQSMVGVHSDSEAHAQYALLARRQGRLNTCRRFAQVGLDRRVDRQN